MGCRKAQEVLDSFDEFNQQSLYIDMLYFNVTYEIEILSINRIENDEINILEREQRVAAEKPPTIVNTRVGYLLTILMVKSFAWLLYNIRCNSIQRFVTKLSVGSSYQPRVGRTDLVLSFSGLGTSGRSQMLIQDMEIAIPYEQVRTAISVLRNHFLTAQKYPLLPIYIRWPAKSACATC